jgi:transcriptional regulator with XRE-family HTH domain
MAEKGNRDSVDLVRQLEAEMDLREVKQEALAELLGISQGHLSKIMSGKVQAGRRTAARIRQLAGSEPVGRKNADHWLSAVEEAAKRSLPFRTVVNAALKMAAQPAAKRRRRG